MGLIYGIKYKDKVVYVGQTKKTLQERIKLYKQAVKDRKKKTYVVNHLRKHFLESEFVVLYILSENEDINELEIKYISEYKTLYPDGMNLTSGGESCIISEESRKKMSKSRLGKEPWNKNTKGLMKAWNKGKKTGPQTEEIKNKKKRFAETNHFYGRKHSEETLKKISENRKGHTAHNKIKGKVYQYDSDWNLIKVYEDISEAVKAGFESSSIGRSHREKNKHKGFYFIRENYDNRTTTGTTEREGLGGSLDNGRGLPDAL